MQMGQQRQYEVQLTTETASRLDRFGYGQICWVSDMQFNVQAAIMESQERANTISNVTIPTPLLDGGANQDKALHTRQRL